MATEDMDCDEELPHLKSDEAWSHVTVMEASAPRKVHRIEGVDSNAPEIELLQVKLQKDREMKFVVKGIVMYCLFLVILLIIVKSRTDINAFLMKNNLVNSFIKPGHSSLDLVKKIKTTDDFWYWSQNVIMQELRAQRNYNNEPPYGLRGFLNDQTNRIMGYGIMRQIRTNRFSCAVTNPMNIAINECSGNRGLETEDSRDFCAGWISKKTFPDSCEYDEFKYISGEELQTFTQLGRLGTYGAGGYVFRLKGTQNYLIDRMKELQKHHWVDRHTRVVFIEFSIYNANVNLFATCTINIEFIDGGGVVPKWRFEPVKLLTVGSSSFDKLVFVCEILFVISTASFTIKELWAIKKEKCLYFSQYWNLAELCIIMISYLAIALSVYKSMLAQQAVKLFNETRGNAYVRLDTAVLVDQFYLYMLGVIMFFSILKLIKLLQFNKRMAVLALTIESCWDELSYFFIAFGVIFFSFCCLFYFMFLTQIKDFSNVSSAIQTSFKMMLGKFDFEAMNRANSLSPILFFFFSIMNSMVLINIMLTIILQAFNEVKSDMETKANRYDVIDYMWKSFTKFTLQQPNSVHQVPTTDAYKKQSATVVEEETEETEALPDKVGELVQYISDVYFGGKLDTSNSQAMKRYFGAGGAGGRAASAISTMSTDSARSRVIFLSD